MLNSLEPQLVWPNNTVNLDQAAGKQQPHTAVESGQCAFGPKRPAWSPFFFSSSPTAMSLTVPSAVSLPHDSRMPRRGILLRRGLSNHPSHGRASPTSA
jgi:hypothetical protein